MDGSQWLVPEADTASEAKLQALEDLSVNGVYNAIAPHFSATRCSSCLYSVKPTWEHHEASYTCRCFAGNALMCRFAQAG